MGAELNAAQRLHALGQSLWLDSINRVMLRTGTLARYVRDLAVTGLTSNPTILGHAMAAGSDYDRSLARLAGEGVTDAQDLVYALALEDLTEAAALFRPEWERTEGVDGYVSLEVPPDVAYDAAATVALARRLHDQVGFANLLVKIPGTPQGLTAMEEVVTAGIGVNVTLLFSDTHYLRTADAYQRALERRRRAGLDLAVPSVASLFISRWDSAADPLLPSALHGSLGLAMAQKTYASHVQLLHGGFADAMFLIASGMVAALVCRHQYLLPDRGLPGIGCFHPTVSDMLARRHLRLGRKHGGRLDDLCVGC
jgi:transaldolase